MSDDKAVISKISDLVAKASEEVLTKFPALKQATPIERGMAINRLSDAETASLAAAIREENLFGDLRTGWIEHGNGGQAIQNHMLPHILIDAAIQGRSVEALISDAIALASLKSSAEIWFTPIAGIKLVGKAVLADDVNLIPWSEVPDSPQKTKFGNTSRMISDFTQFTAIPTAAIVKHIAPQQVLFSASPPPSDVGRFKDMISRTEETNDIVRCITALTVRPVAALGSWSQLTNAYANWLVGVSYSWGEALFDAGVSVTPAELYPAVISELFRKFVQLNASDRNVLRIALDRLNQALRERRIVDKAIDQGIALEILLLHGISSTSELSYRQSIRGAAFLGGGKEDRQATFNTLRSAYDLRSVAVHTGSLGKKEDQEAVEVMKDAARICASVARKVIDRGSFPDWEIEFVLNGT
jgi:hypothetical protein